MTHLLGVEIQRKVVDADFNGRLAAEEVAEHTRPRRRKPVTAARQRRRPAAQDSSLPREAVRVDVCVCVCVLLGSPMPRGRGAGLAWQHRIFHMLDWRINRPVYSRCAGQQVRRRPSHAATVTIASST